MLAATRTIAPRCRLLCPTQGVRRRVFAIVCHCWLAQQCRVPDTASHCWQAASSGTREMERAPLAIGIAIRRVDRNGELAGADDLIGRAVCSATFRHGDRAQQLGPHRAARIDFDHDRALDLHPHLRRLVRRRVDAGTKHGALPAVLVAKLRRASDRTATRRRIARRSRTTDRPRLSAARASRRRPPCGRQENRRAGWVGRPSPCFARR